MRPVVLLSGVAIAGAVLLIRPAGAQRGAQASPPSRLSHVGIVVRDLERAIEQLASLTGADKAAVAVERQDGAVGARAAVVRLSNISLELLEPVAGTQGNSRGVVQSQGVGIHHLGLVRDPATSLSEERDRLVRLGGTNVRSNRERAFVSLTPRLGPLVELLSPALRERLYGTASPAPRLDAAAPFAQMPCLTHVGIVVRDLEQASRTYAELFGLDPPPIQPLDAATGRARYTIFTLQNVSVELLQQAAGVRGTYADFLGTEAQRVHHMGLYLRGRDTSFRTVAEQISWLERHGGRMGTDAGHFAYVDVSLGVFIEALADETINRVYPCR